MLKLRKMFVVFETKTDRLFKKITVSTIRNSKMVDLSGVQGQKRSEKPLS